MIPIETEIAAYCINLDRAHDRWANMSSQFAKLGIPVQRISAIDGKADPSKIAGMVNNAAFRQKIGRNILPAEVGCYLSHMLVWRNFLESDRRFCLVLEDDVVFHTDFVKALEFAVKTEKYWDMLKLNKIRAKLPICQFRSGGYSLNAYLGPATGFGAYIITRELASRLLPRMLPIRLPVDYEGTRYWAHDFRLIGLEPWPSHVDDGGVSTITGRNFEEVKKAPRWRRLGNLSMRAGNYFRRLFWLARHGALLGLRK